MEDIFKGLFGFIGIVTIPGWVVFFVKYGWERADALVSKHKRVCDVCWRDINKVNEYLENNGKVL